MQSATGNAPLCSENTKRLAFFSALCLFLASVEYAIPKPLPFLRLGLANLPILLSLTKLSRRGTLLLIALKVLLQALVSGTIFSYVFLFSLAGSSASGLTMLLLHMLFAKRKLVSAVGLSLAGAMANACAQLSLSKIMLFKEGTRYIAPLLLCTAFISGTLLGLFAAVFTGKSQWYKNLPDAESAQGRKGK